MTEKSKPEKLSGVDHLIRTLFRALGINLEDLKLEVEARIAPFEQGLHLLNRQLQTLAESQLEIRQRQHINYVLLKRICEHLEIESCVEMPMENDYGKSDQRQGISAPNNVDEGSSIRA
jgi:hypothetical protein